MSTSEHRGFHPAAETGLNSRYHLEEHEHRRREAEAAQDWFDRVNRYTELHERLNGLYYEFSPVDTDTPSGRGIVIDHEQIFKLEDMQ